jgi:hypothetical protein
VKTTATGPTTKDKAPPAPATKEPVGAPPPSPPPSPSTSTPPPTSDTTTVPQTAPTPEPAPKAPKKKRKRRGIESTEPVPVPVGPQADDGAAPAGRKVGPVKVEKKPRTSDRADKANKADKAKAKRDDQDPAARKRRRILVGTLAVVVVIAAAAVAVVLLRHKSGGSNGTAVGSAATATMHLHSASVTFDVKPAGGQDPSSHGAVQVPGLAGSGTVDFKATSASLSLNSGLQPTEQMILDKKAVYLNPGPLVGQLAAGKSWISATTDDLGTTGTSTSAGFAQAPTVFEETIGNPKGLLNELKAMGVKATSFGGSIYQGTPVQGYAVTLTQTEINNRLNHLPSSLRSVASGVHATEDVYVTTNGLVRAIVVPATIQANGSSSTEDIEVVFSGWGDPVHVTTPASSQVISWAQFKSVLTFTSKLH